MVRELLLRSLKGRMPAVAFAVGVLAFWLIFSPTVSIANLSRLAAHEPTRFDACPSQTDVAKRSGSPNYSGRIRIRRSLNGREFLDNSTGQRFIPRGNNYIRLALLEDPWGGYNFGHSLFDSDHYNAACTRRALSAMRAMNYNVVRIFVSEISSGNPSGEGLNLTYMRNFADFLMTAKQIGVHAIVVFWRLPRQGGYQLETQLPAAMEGTNAYFLYQPIIDIKRRYVGDFIRTLKSLGAPLEAVLAWDLENEAHLMEDQRPLSLSSGQVKAANGRFYDMASPADRTDLISEGLVYWANQVSAEVKKFDPEGLTTISFFSPAIVEGKDPRITAPKRVALDPGAGGSTLDFIDIHLYPGAIPIQDELRSFEVRGSSKPLILGEMGIEYYPAGTVKSASEALSKLRALQSASCEFGVTGWVLYSWDTLETANGRRDIFSGYDDGWLLARALSPERRPDPCARTVAQSG